MRRLACGVLAIVLAGCGEEPRATGPTSGAGRGPVLEGLPEAPRRTAQDDVDDAVARLGGNVVEDAAKAKALADRTLTSSDVLTFLTVQPLVRALGDDPVEVQRVVSAYGVSVLEWTVLTSRVLQGWMHVRFGRESAGAQIVADAEVVRPYADRLDAMLDRK
ncbi:MAG: hypothetical protein U1E39_08890 [Planctomycetota bacterium]